MLRSLRDRWDPAPNSSLSFNWTQSSSLVHHYGKAIEDKTVLIRQRDELESSSCHRRSLQASINFAFDRLERWRVGKNNYGECFLITRKIGRFLQSMGFGFELLSSHSRLRLFSYIIYGISCFHIWWNFWLLISKESGMHRPRSTSPPLPTSSSIE